VPKEGERHYNLEMKERLLLRIRSWSLFPTLRAVAFSAWILDIMSCLYMVKWWQAKNPGESILQLAATANQLETIPDEMRAEMLGMSEMLFAGMLWALIINNSIFYLGYAFGKRWAVPYVTGYVLTAAAFGAIMLFEGFPVGGAWELVNILGLPAYVLLGAIAWARKPEMMDGAPAAQ